MKENKTYPIISVVMPIYNTARYLRMSIPSVMAQEYPNLEIVLLNNGSTDDSLTIIEDYAQQDARIKVYTIEHVCTPKESRDNAIYRAKGEWIIAVDSDDAIDRDHISKLWKRHEETNADCICGRMCYRDGKSILSGSIPANDFDMSQVMSGEKAMLKTLYNWEIGFNGALVKRDVFINLAPEHPDTIYTDECDTRIYFEHCEKVAFADSIYWVTCNQSSVSRTPSTTGLLYHLITMVGLYNYFKEKLGKNSILTTGIVLQTNRVFRKALNDMRIYRKSVKNQLTETQKKHIESAYCILKENKNIVGPYRWLRSEILYLLYKYIVK